MNALEVSQAAMSGNEFTWFRFSLHPHRNISSPILLKRADVFPSQILCFRAVPHARIGKDQHIVAQAAHACRVIYLPFPREPICVGRDKVFDTRRG